MTAPLRIAINGLGRIGRCVMRALVEEKYDDIEIAVVNGPASLETHLHLLQYDSVHGRFPGQIHIENNCLVLPGQPPIPVLHERNIEQLDWRAHNVDIVLECTGVFTTRHDLERHLAVGAKAVILSAPAKSNDVPTFVLGVNHGNLGANDRVFSIGSCTTNCLAPIAQVLHTAFGIEAGFMTTIHSYTADQNLVDGTHKDLRRARAAAMSMVPTSTGAAKTLGRVLPELAGRLDGTAIRVPTPNVSMVDLSFRSEKPMSKEKLNAELEGAAHGAYSRVMQATHKPLVSIDFTHTSASSVVDLTATHLVGDRFARIAAWYDNEWGFSCRMLDMARLAGAS